jgi:hypothetical protein
MADTPQNSHTFSRHIAPFAPLALALLMNAVPPANKAGLVEMEAPTETTAAKCDEVADFTDCHSRFPTGCSAAAGYDAYLNLLKNDVIPPPPPTTQIKFLSQTDYTNLDANIPSGLTRNNHEDFGDELKRMGEGQLFGLVGYLYYAIHSGSESSNCQLNGPPGDPQFSNVDYHIGIGFDPAVAAQLRGGATPEPVAATAKSKSPRRSKSSGSGASELQQTSVIVEMTPHTRFQFENNIWTLDNLKAAVGRKVKVMGQLLIDSEHNAPSQNCASAKTSKQKSTCWRASVWELHPVVDFQVCATDSCDTPDSPDWVPLDVAVATAPTTNVAESRNGQTSIGASSKKTKSAR